MKTGVDAHIGNRLKMTREFRGFSSESAVALTEIELNRWLALESGSARVTGADLSACARAFAVAPEFFFRGLPGWPRMRRREETPVPAKNNPVVALIVALQQRLPLHGG